MNPRIAHAQKGATLVVALIMLAIITLVVIGGFTLSNSNLKAVGNMQMREEALAAGNRAIEVVLGSAFTSPAAAQTINVDINADGNAEFEVAVEPFCTRAIVASNPPPSSIGLTMGGGAGKTWHTDWDIRAIVNDTATGAQVEAHQGVRVLLSDADKVTYCDAKPAPSTSGI